MKTLPAFIPHILLFLAQLIYAANYTIAKEVMPNYISPFGFVLLRVIFGLSFFLLFHTLFIKEKVDKSDIPRFILCGVFGITINQLMFLKGLNWTTPINASLIMTTTPILVLVISALLLGEKITSKKVLGIGLGAAGAIFLITYGQEVAINKNGMLGDLMIFINALSYGIYIVLAKSLMKKYNPITVVKWAFTFGIFFVFPFGIQEVLAIDWASFPTAIWWAVFYVLLCTTVFAYLFNSIGLKFLNASTVSVYIYLQPLLAGLIALFFAKDVLTIEKVFAGLLIFVGVYLVSQQRKDAESERPEVGSKNVLDDGEIG